VSRLEFTHLSRADSAACAAPRQIGSGERSEKIRTYNVPQDRVTDHRIDLTVHGVEAVLNGDSLDRLVDALAADAEARALSELSTNGP